jgi:hypothetical protein
MPRYFFTIRRPGRVKDDPHGTDLPDVPAALSHAERQIQELRRESPYNDPALVMIVKDEARKMVLSLPFFPGCYSAFIKTGQRTRSPTVVREELAAEQAVLERYKAMGAEFDFD